MKFLKRLVVASLVAIALIEMRDRIATAQPHPLLEAATARPLLSRDSQISRIRRKILLRAERLGLKPAPSRSHVSAIFGR
jgi:hypothetical protein